MYADVVVVAAVFVLKDPYVVVVSCRLEIENAVGKRAQRIIDEIKSVYTVKAEGPPD